jgi:UDP-N-acetyl-2-amino-2-deoxyglucuronate dehydrogenase
MSQTTSPPAAPEGGLSIALIGLGGVGRLHLEAYRQLATARVIAVADPGAASAAIAAPVPCYADHREMLDRVRPDIACVLTPASTHEAIVLDCAARGVHVLCEKPLALSEASAARMTAACREAGVELFYGASYRHLPAVRRARELIVEGAVGDIVLMREQVVGGSGPEGHSPLSPVHYPHGGPGGGGMGLVDHGVHLIDLFEWFNRAPVASVFGRGNISGEPARAEHLHMNFANGAVGQLLYDDATFATDLPSEGMFSGGGDWNFHGPVAAGGWSAHPGAIHVHGTKGALRIFHYANALYLTDRDGVRQIPLPDQASPRHFAVQMQAFIDDIEAGRGASAPGEAGQRALRILLAAYRSMETGGLVAV